MMKNIYGVSMIAIAILVIFYIIFNLKKAKKREEDNIKTKKSRVMFDSVIFILFIIHTIAAATLDKPGFIIGCNILCAIICAYGTATDLISLDMPEAPSDDEYDDIKIVMDANSEDASEKITKKLDKENKE